MQTLKETARQVRFAAMQPAAVDRRQDTVVATWQANGRNWRELRVWSNGRFAYFTQWEFQSGVWA